jgi:hypothetical protein
MRRRGWRRASKSVLLYEETRATLSLQFVGSRTLSGLTVNQIGVYVLNPFPERADDDDPDLAEFETATAAVALRSTSTL